MRSNSKSKTILFLATLIAAAFPVAVQAQARCTIDIVSAQYGWKRWGDVTRQVRERCQDRENCSFPVENDLFGDPDPGEDKFLKLEVRSKTVFISSGCDRPQYRDDPRCNPYMGQRTIEFKEYDHAKMTCGWTSIGGNVGDFVYRY